MKKRTSALHRALERLLPPNVPAGTVHWMMLASLALGTFIAAVDFAVRYSSVYRGLFRWDGKLRGDALMNSFGAYAQPVLLVFALVLLLALLSAAILYSSYYLGGRSIYLMRRLPDGKRTLRRQVWTVPLLWAVCAAALGAAVLGLCYLAWRCITPDQCLPTAENVRRVMEVIAASPYSYHG